MMHVSRRRKHYELIGDWLIWDIVKSLEQKLKEDFLVA